jgi:long-chain fatty acid transport protein
MLARRLAIGRLGRAAALAALAVGGLCPARPVSAAGFETEYPDNGARALGRAGAFTARADDPTAVYYNPAGLAGLTGTNLYVGANGLMLDQSFRPADREVAVGTRLVTLSYERVEQSVSFFPAPFLAGQFDFDALPAFDFAVAIYGPASNGHRRFDDQYAVARATDQNGQDASGRIAGNRALHLVPNGMLVESELVQIFPTLAVAWQAPSLPLRVGLSLQNSIVLAQLTQGSGGDHPGQAVVEVADLFAPTGVVGVHYAPHPRLEIGFSLRPPIAVEATGEARLKRYAPCLRDAAGGCDADPELSDRWPLEGELRLYGADQRTEDRALTMRFTNPLWARLGVRYVHRPLPVDGEVTPDTLADPGLFDVELNYLFEADGMHRAYELDFAAAWVNLPAENGEGTFIRMPDLEDRRNYQHTHALRLGGDYTLMPRHLVLRAGVAYETAVSPEAYTHIDFPSTAKLTGALGLGVLFELVDIDLGVSYTHFASRTVTDSGVRLTDIQKPRADWAVNGNGTFEGRYLVFGLSTGWHL